MSDEEELSAFCPLYRRAIELIGRRWTGAILRALRSGRCRFSDIADAVPGLSDRLLSERLKELEAEGLVERIVYPEVPVRIEYRLTEKGRALDQVMDAVATWAHRWLTPESGGDTLVATEETHVLSNQAAEAGLATRH
jgi:DNA-binding HxlR family transcriptional regulator